MLENPRAARVRTIRKLSQRNERRETGRFLLEGPQAVREALETTVAAAAWTGPDAAGFRETWRACSAQPS